MKIKHPIFGIIGLLFILVLITLNSAFSEVTKESIMNGMYAYWAWNNTYNSLDGYGTYIQYEAENGVSFVSDKFGNSNDAIYFDAGDYIKLPSSYNIFNNTFTYSFMMCGWFKTTDTDGIIFTPRYSTNGDIWLIITSDGKIKFHMYDGSSHDVTSISVVNDNNWHFVCAGRDKTYGMKIYVDTILENSNTYTGNAKNQILYNLFGRERLDGNYHYYQGYLDEFMIFNRTLNESEIQWLYNLSVPLYAYNDTTPTPPPEPTLNETNIKTTEINQLSDITINSYSYVPIVNGYFNLTNSTNITMTWTTTIYNSRPYSISVKCRALIDGIDYNTETINSIEADSYLSLYLKSNITELNAGIHNVTFECAKNSVGRFDVMNSKGIVYQMIDDSGENINAVMQNYLSNITSSNWQKLGELNLTTTTNETGDMIRSLIMEADITFTHNSNSEICLYGQLTGEDGTNETIPIKCSYGYSGDKTNGGGFYILKNVSNATTYTLTMYGKSSTSDGQVDGTIIMGEVITHPDELNMSIINQADVGDGSNWVNVTYVEVNVTHTQGVGILVKAGVTSETNADGWSDMRIVDEDGNIGTLAYKDLEANKKGIIVVQDIFDDISEGLHKYYLQARCTNNCTLNGSMIAMITNIQPFIPLYFNVTLYETWTNNSITDFNVTATDPSTGASAIFPAINGTAKIVYDVSLLDLTLQSENYFNRTIYNHNTSENLHTYLIRPLYVSNIYFSNITNYNSINYTRNLTFTVEHGCDDNTEAKLYLYDNGNLTRIFDLRCLDYALINDSFSYQASTEGEHNLTYYMNITFKPEIYNYSFDYSFTYDLNNPTPILFLNVTQYGWVEPEVLISLKCIDTISPILDYNLTFNDVSNLYYNVTEGTYKNETRTNTIDGTNIFIGSCSDFFGTSSDTLTEIIYKKNLCLIDEKDGGNFEQLNNLSSVRVYYDDNSSYYDYKLNNKTCVNFSEINQHKLRFEFVYPDGGVITRYIDTTLEDDDTIRVCINKVGTTHYEQILISVSEKPVYLYSRFAQCYVALDYTRFAYQDAKSLKAFTIATQYYLYTIINGLKTLLASLDGSIQTYINLDTLEFNLNRFDISLTPEVLSTEKTDDYQIKIEYLNKKNDNEAVHFEIIRMETNEVVVSDNATDPNNFVVYFDWTGKNYSENEQFMIKLYITKDDGTQKTMTRYFNLKGSRGVFPTGLAIALALGLFFIGLTLTISKTTFNFFGIFILLAAIGILSLAPSTWFITFLIVIMIVALIWVVIIALTNQKVTRFI